MLLLEGFAEAGLSPIGRARDVKFLYTESFRLHSGRQNHRYSDADDLCADRSRPTWTHKSGADSRLCHPGSTGFSSFWSPVRFCRSSPSEWDFDHQRCSRRSRDDRNHRSRTRYPSYPPPVSPGQQSIPGRSADQFASFDPTPQEVVERLLVLGDVKRGDTVYDLGSGDGRVI